jgi:hypothetical protein
MEMAKVWLVVDSRWGFRRNIGARIPFPGWEGMVGSIVYRHSLLRLCLAFVLTGSQSR